jgi:hypothetical protein
MNIVEFRKKNPAYDDLSDQELSDALYSKYYSDLDRSEFDDAFTGGPLGEEREQERARLEKEFAVAEQEREAAQRTLEGAEDTVLENLAEGIQEMSAAGVGAVADVATLIASPVTYALEQTLDVDIPTGREALAMIDPRLDPNQQFMEERGLLGAGGVRLAGELATVGAGFVPVARDATKVSSALYDIAGIGMTETAIATNAAQIVKKGFDLDSVEGVKEYADDAAIRYDVEQARPQFEEYENFNSKVLPDYEKKMAKLGKAWDKASKAVDKADTRLRNSLESGDADRIDAAQDALTSAETKLKEIEELFEEAPVAPSVGGSTAERRAFIKQELRDAGVAEDVIKQVVLPQRYRKATLFDDLMQYDLQSMKGLYEIDLKQANNIYKRTARQSITRTVAPVASLVARVAGPKVGRLFESAFETSARNSELFLSKYTSKENQNSLSELSEWAEQDEVKAKFLDLHTAETTEQANLMLKDLFESASQSVTKEANDLFKKLVADSKAHQNETRRLYREDVRQDQIFWASGKLKETDEIPDVDVGVSQTVEGTAERTRKLASEMSSEELNNYANPILEQLNRISDEQTMLELAKAFRVRPALSVGDNVNVFHKALRETITQQAGNAAVGKTTSRLIKDTMEGAKSAPHGFVRNLMKLSYGGTLGQFDSAFMNLHDAAVAMARNGVAPTLKGMLQREGMDITEFGIGGSNKNIAEFQSGFDDMMNSSAWDNAANLYQDVAFKLSGFRGADRLGKGIVIRSSLNKFRSLAKDSKKYFKELENYASPQELTKIRSALLKNKTLDEMPDSVKEIVLRMSFSRLGEQQLISAAGRPLNYLGGRNRRIFYALTGFAIKQAELMRQGIIQNIKKGEYKDAGSFAARYMIFAGFGYGLINQARGIPQAMLGDERKAPTVEGLLFDTVMQPVQVATFNKLGSKYANQRMLEDPVDYLTESMIPPFGLPANIFKDVSNALQQKDPKLYTLRSIPGGDELRAFLLEQTDY